EVQLKDDSPAATVESAEPDPFLKEKLQRLVASLPEKQRAVVILRYTEDMDPGEIAELMKMPITTVRSHLQRALAVLREKASRVLKEEVYGPVRKRSS